MTISDVDAVTYKLFRYLKLFEDIEIVLEDSFSLIPEAGKPYWRHVLNASFGSNREMLSFGGIDTDRSIALIKSIMEFFEIVAQIGDQNISSTGWAAGLSDDAAYRAILERYERDSYVRAVIRREFLLLPLSCLMEIGIVGKDIDSNLMIVRLPSRIYWVILIFNSELDSWYPGLGIGSTLAEAIRKAHMEYIQSIDRIDEMNQSCSSRKAQLFWKEAILGNHNPIQPCVDELSKPDVICKTPRVIFPFIRVYHASSAFMYDTALPRETWCEYIKRHSKVAFSINDAKEATTPIEALRLH